MGSVCLSFHTTIKVLEGLLEYEKATGGTPASREARRSGEAYLLERNLFRRRSTGEPADEQFSPLSPPKSLGATTPPARSTITDPPRCTPAPLPIHASRKPVNHVRSKRLADGTRPLDWIPEGQVWFQVDAGPSKPSKWVTLRAMRVLKWWEEQRR